MGADKQDSSTSRENVVLVTGASGGIGEATAYELARRGADLILAARRSAELDRVADRIVAEGGRRPLCIAADITSPEDCARIARETEAAHGRLHALVNNAGVTAHGRFDESDLVVARRAMELNFFAQLELTQRLLPLLRRAPGWKKILLVSTPSGLYGVPGRFAYSASKAAAHAWMESLRIELRADRIHTILFCPGYTATALRTSGLAADGGVLQEEQAKSARSPEDTAKRLVRALGGRRRVVLTNLPGRLTYWWRTLAPAALEALMRKKLKKDFLKADESDSI